MTPLNIRVPVRRLRTVLLLAPPILLLLSYLGVVGQVAFEVDFLAKFNETFDLGRESNIPTFYQSLVFLGGGVLMILLGLRASVEGTGHARQWFVLGAAFLFFAVDESAMIHERFSTPMRSLTGVDGYLYYAWMIVWVPATVLLVTYVVPLLRNLPRRTAGAFVLGGIIFFVGAVGTELIQSKLASQSQQDTLTYATVGQIQEFLELIGLAVFSAALVGYADNRLGAVSMALVSEDPRHAIGSEPTPTHPAPSTTENHQQHGLLKR